MNLHVRNIKNKNGNMEEKASGSYTDDVIQQFVEEIMQFFTLSLFTDI